MGWDDDEEETPTTRSSYSPAEAAADLARYVGLKRSVMLWALLLVVVVALPVAHWSAWSALSLVVGGICGVANALLSMAGNERLVDRRNVAAFVLSSFVRLGLFGIVPVVLALRQPSLATVGCYFAGFFMPLALYGLSLQRAYRRK